MLAPVSITRNGAGHSCRVIVCQQPGRPPGVGAGQILLPDIGIGRPGDCARGVGAERVAVVAEGVVDLGPDSVEIAYGAEDFGTALVEQLAGADQIGGSPRQVWSATTENVGAGAAQSGRGQQRRVQVGLLAVERTRCRHGVVERVPQVRRGIGVRLTERGEPPDIGVDFAHLGIHVVEDRIAVHQRGAELVAQSCRACAAALSVRLTLTGSTFSAIEMSVSNTVLNSGVTDLASITVDGVVAWAAG